MQPKTNGQGQTDSSPVAEPELLSRRYLFQLLGQRSLRTFALMMSMGFGASLGFGAGGPSGSAVATPIFSKQRSGRVGVIRIGYQKSGTLLLLKARGVLERRLRPLGVSVRWSEFTAGPPLLEALNAGSLDFGHTGDAPAIFAQAAGSPLVYVANTRPSPQSVALIVPGNSPLRRVSDLRGKRVAFARGSSAHYFIVQALVRYGLKYEDIQAAFLNPPDARLAFERGNVDAWAIWDPFYAAAQRGSGARVLVDGSGLTPFREFYLARRDFASRQSDLVRLAIEETQKVGNWAIANPRPVAELLAVETGVDLATLELAERRRRRYGAQLIQTAVIQEQQQIANTFSRLGLLPRSINVRDAVWRPT